MTNKEKQAEIEKRLALRVVEDLTAIDTESLYDQMLDECYSFESVGGIFAGMSPSRVLAEVDPTAYRCGKNDWEDGESRDQWEEIDGSYYDRAEVAELREEIEAEIDDEIEAEEAEAEEADEDEETDTDTRAV